MCVCVCVDEYYREVKVVVLVDLCCVYSNRYIVYVIEVDV